MSIGDAARLDRAMLRMRDLHAEIRIYEAEATEVCEASAIDPKDLNSGAVRVNLRTGDITRPSPSPGPGRKP